MIDLLLRHILPAAYGLLPPAMESDAATAFLVAIALQESALLDRRQRSGPACGFWQFEVSGVRAVLEHERTRGPIIEALASLRYSTTMYPAELQSILADNDILAACFARCLLWASRSTPLPLGDEADLAWIVYMDTWRPGRPRRQSWRKFYDQGWAHTRESRKV